MSSLFKKMICKNQKGISYSSMCWVGWQVSSPYYSGRIIINLNWQDTLDVSTLWMRARSASPCFPMFCRSMNVLLIQTIVQTVHKLQPCMTFCNGDELLSPKERVLYLGLCLFVCLSAQTLVFFSTTACWIETKFSPEAWLLMQNVLMIIMMS